MWHICYRLLANERVCNKYWYDSLVSPGAASFVHGGQSQSGSAEEYESTWCKLMPGTEWSVTRMKFRFADLARGSLKLEPTNEMVICPWLCTCTSNLLMVRPWCKEARARASFEALDGTRHEGRAEVFGMHVRHETCCALGDVQVQHGGLLPSHHEHLAHGTDVRLAKLCFSARVGSQLARIRWAAAHLN